MAQKFEKQRQNSGSTWKVKLGIAQNSLCYMAGGEEKLLQKNLLAPYEIIAENTTAQFRPVIFSIKDASAPYS